MPVITLDAVPKATALLVMDGKVVGMLSHGRLVEPSDVFARVAIPKPVAAVDDPKPRTDADDAADNDGGDQPVDDDMRGVRLGRRKVTFDDRARIKQLYQEAKEGRQRAPRGWIDKIAGQFNYEPEQIRHVLYNTDGY